MNLIKILIGISCFISTTIIVNAVEIAPSTEGTTIIINTTDVEVNTDPYESIGTIEISSGGVLTNFVEFIMNGNFTINQGGKLVNDSVNGNFLIEELQTLTSDGTIDNGGQFTNAWAFNSGANSIFNNLTTGSFVNSETFNQGGIFNNFGNVINTGKEGDNAGFFNNSGTTNNFTGTTFRNRGTVQNFSNGIFNNSGLFLSERALGAGIISGKFNNYGIFNNNSNGVYDNNGKFVNSLGAVLNNSGMFINNARGLGPNIAIDNEIGATINNLSSGTFSISKGIVNDGTFNNAGIVRILTGINLNGIGTYTQTGGLTEVGGILGGSAINIQGGTISGTGSTFGTLVVGAEATISPGLSSVGTLTINGDVDFSGITATELGDISTYDILDISGTATLSGTLDVMLVDLGTGIYSPSLGDTFDILTASLIIGTFSQLNLDTLSEGLAWEVSYISLGINIDAVRLTVISAVPIPAAIWLFGIALVMLVGMTRTKI